MTNLVPTALPEGTKVYHHLKEPGDWAACMLRSWPCDACGAEQGANTSHLHIRSRGRLKGVCSERCAMQVVVELNAEGVTA
jgi:hypothetical protein